MSAARKLKQPTEYEVGYGKPPAHSRFRPGQSGNPRGRPRGARNRPTLPGPREEKLKTLIMEEAYRPVTVKDGDNQVTMPMAQARELAGGEVTLQGNLDPMRVIVGGQALDHGVDAILQATKGRPHIFNLGHGITPDTPVEHVARLVDRVRGRASA